MSSISFFLSIVFLIFVGIPIFVCICYWIGLWVRQQKIYQRGFDAEDMILDLLYEWTSANHISAKI